MAPDKSLPPPANDEQDAEWPLVSVMMTVTQPDSTFFAQAVESVLGQTLARFELIIVEKPSHSSAASLLERYSDTRIHHFLTSPQSTLVQQRNLALDHARSEYVAVLDADDVCEPNRLEVQYHLLRNNPQIAVLGSQLVIIDERGSVIGRRGYPCESDDVVRAMSRFNAIGHPSVMFRRSIILSAGSYSYSRFPATEDYELWSRLAKLGTVLANHPEALLRYRLHSKSLKSLCVHGILRGTLDVKRRYWRDRMDIRARLRFWAEHALLLMPANWVLGLFRSCVVRPEPASVLASNEASPRT
jgi:glycosyltransferase involved in cell wall biosynthesis